MTEQTAPALSVALITLNEERNISACLDSVRFASEAVLVDSGSTDRTRGIASDMGARVFEEPWKGYGEQKNSAILKCTSEWVLLIDADERVPEDAARAIMDLLRSGPECDAYSLRRKNYFHGRWIRFSGNWPDRQVRLFRKSTGRFHGDVHEEWKTTGRVCELDAHLDHYSYDSYSDMLRKLDEYSTLSAEQLRRRGVRPGAWKPFTHGLGMFLRTYFINLGFMHGMDGFMMAMFKALGSFMKYAKLHESGLNQNQR